MRGEIIITQKEMEKAIIEYYQKRGFNTKRVRFKFFYLHDGVPSEGVGFELDYQSRLSFKLYLSD